MQVVAVPVAAVFLKPGGGDGADEEAARGEVEVVRRRVLLPASSASQAQQLATRAGHSYQLLRREGCGRQSRNVGLQVP